MIKESLTKRLSMTLIPYKIKTVSFSLCFVLSSFAHSSELHKAVTIGDTKKLSVLLLTTEIHERDKNNQTALHVAVKLKSLESIKLLLKADIFIDGYDNYKKTALHWAVESEFLEAIQLLIRQGADLHIEDNKGNTPLSMLKKNRKLSNYFSIPKRTLNKCVRIFEKVKMSDIMASTPLIRKITNQPPVNKAFRDAVAFKDYKVHPFIF